MAFIQRGKGHLKSLLKYDYTKFTDNYERHFILGGAVVGAVTPMMLSKRRHTFNECVAGTTAGVMLGSIGGWVACAIHPFIVVGAVLGGPVWMLQRVRFPETSAELS